MISPIQNVFFLFKKNITRTIRKSFPQQQLISIQCRSDHYSAIVTNCYICLLCVCYIHTLNWVRTERGGEFPKCQEMERLGTIFAIAQKGKRNKCVSFALKIAFLGPHIPSAFSGSERGGDFLSWGRGTDYIGRT